jgi:hypothetical protein
MMTMARSMAVLGTLALLGWSALASAEERHGGHAGHGAHARSAAHPAEIVAILEADPGTDWSAVDIGRLREHLVDMSAVTLRATVAATAVDGGLSMTITGSGRTRDALRRMVPAHAVELDAMDAWSATAEATPEGARLTVTAPDPALQAKIRALGFFGLMATGGHHQAHHLAMARGMAVHRHE